MTEKDRLSPSRYKILGLVGRGQFGRVFCARNRKTSDLVALKELDPQRFPTNKLLRELRFLLALQHQNIVSCISLEHSKQNRYLVMEYCEAGTLRELVTPNYQLDLQQCISLTIDILLGLEHAHSLNIIHCDIKPENVLLKLTETGWRAKVSDFGIARLSQEIDRSGGTGSPGYMAPERFYGQFSIGSDIYAVGIILYELLLKHRPFSGKPSELMVAHINQRVDIPASLPPVLHSILVKSLQKLPGRRFTTAAQMRQELVNAINLPELAGFNLSQISTSEYDEEGYFHQVRPIYLPESISQQNDHDSDKLVALAIDSYQSDSPLLNTYIYSATRSQLQRHKLNDLQNVEPLVKVNADIKDIVVNQNQKYVITEQYIYRISNSKNQLLHKANQKFLWTISPQNNWLAVASRNNLEIKKLIVPKVIKVDFTDRQIVAIAALDRHHLAVVAHKPKSLDSRIFVVSRRGNIMGKFILSATVKLAIASHTNNRLLLVEALNPNFLMLVDLKPYRVQRIILNYSPYLIKSTKWGYILAAESEDSSTTSNLHLLDSQAQNVGCLVVHGKVAAIAVVNDHLFTVATESGNYGKLHVVDLKQLDVDLIF